MDMLIAVGHLVGSVVAWVLLGVIIFAGSAWFDERRRASLLAEAAIHLGTSVSELEAGAKAAEFTKWTADRHSSELLRNRISDALGVIRAIWDWIGLAAVLATLVGVGWIAFTDDLSNAVNAWWILPIYTFFVVTNTVYCLLCIVLTGRIPGQARAVRKELAKRVA